MHHTIRDHEERWHIESLAIIDDCKDAKGSLLLTSVKHASDQARASYDSFLPIEWDSSILEGIIDCAISIRDASRRENRLYRSKIVVGRVFAFLRRNPGMSATNSHGRMYYCVKAAIINAVFALCGAFAAENVQRCVDIINISILGSIYVKEAAKCDDFASYNETDDTFRWAYRTSDAQILKPCIADIARNSLTSCEKTNPFTNAVIENVFAPHQTLVTRVVFLIKKWGKCMIKVPFYSDLSHDALHLSACSVNHFSTFTESVSGLLVSLR
eukprot:IDg3825t1